MDIETIADGVWRITADKEGPVMAIVGGVHGDERTGIQVVRQLTSEFQCQKHALRHGTLFLVLGNPVAIAKNEADGSTKDHRGSQPEADLNRCFTDEILYGNEDSPYENSRARELARLLSGVEIGIDIHATSKPSQPFVFCQRTPTTADERVYRWFGVQHIVSDPQMVFAGKRVTLDEYFAQCGGVGICYETGFAADTSRSDEVIKETLNVLTDFGLLGNNRGVREYHSFDVKPQHIYTLEKEILAPSPSSRWRKGFGEYSFQRAPANTAAMFVSASGDIENPIWDNHVVIFPKPESRWQPNKPIGYLGRLR